MDWTKIKTKHFLYSELSKPLKGDLADLLCLTAHLEELPTERQMTQICRKKSINLLQIWFISRSNSLENVLGKVLEDVDKINHKKELSRVTSDTYRKKHTKHNTKSDASPDGQVTTQRREEKRREDKRGIDKKEITHPPHVSVSKEEQNRLLDHYRKSTLLEYVERLNDYAEQFPKKFKEYKSHAATIRTWMRRDGVKKVPKEHNTQPGAEVDPGTAKENIQKVGDLTAGVLDE